MKNSNKLFLKVVEQDVVVFEQYNVHTFVSFSLLIHALYSLNDDEEMLCFLNRYLNDIDRIQSDRLINHPHYRVYKPELELNIQISRKVKWLEYLVEFSA
jgi:hypothetical protein